MFCILHNTLDLFKQGVNGKADVVECLHLFFVRDKVWVSDLNICVVYMGKEFEGGGVCGPNVTIRDGGDEHVIDYTEEELLEDFVGGVILFV